MTIVDIAKHVGVTPTTVSKVLNRAKSDVRISDATRNKVMAAVKDLNYRPSFSARALRKGRTFSLGYICGDIEMPFFSEMTALAMKEAEDRGYHLLVSATLWNPEKELQCLEMLLQRGVDGILAHSRAFQPGIPLVDDLRKRNFPLVALTNTESAFPSVGSDWSEGMQQAVRHLREKGHKRIGYVGCRMHSDVSPYHKFPNIVQACEKVGLVLEKFITSNETEEIRRFGAELGKRSDRPGAFIAFSDYIAMSFLAGLQDAGLRIPEEAAVIGIDGTKASGRMHPALTTVAQDHHRIIVHAIETVLARLDGEDTPNERTLFPTKLMVRQSS